MKPRTAHAILFAVLCSALVNGGERRAASYLPDGMFLAIVYDGGHPGMKETTASAFFREPEVVEAMKAIQPMLDRLWEAMGEEDEEMGVFITGMAGGEIALPCPIRIGLRF